MSYGVLHLDEFVNRMQDALAFHDDVLLHARAANIHHSDYQEVVHAMGVQMVKVMDDSTRFKADPFAVLFNPDTGEPVAIAITDEHNLEMWKAAFPDWKPAPEVEEPEAGEIEPEPEGDEPPEPEEEELPEPEPRMVKTVDGEVELAVLFDGLSLEQQDALILWIDANPAKSLPSRGSNNFKRIVGKAGK